MHQDKTRNENDSAAQVLKDLEVQGDAAKSKDWSIAEARKMGLSEAEINTYIKGQKGEG